MFHVFAVSNDSDGRLLRDQQPGVLRASCPRRYESASSRCRNPRSIPDRPENYDGGTKNYKAHQPDDGMSCIIMHDSHVHELYDTP